MQVIECNLRASRALPLRLQGDGLQLRGAGHARDAGRGRLGRRTRRVDLDYVAVKAPQFSFTRLKGADPILRVEMASTGEVATSGATCTRRT